MRKLNLSIRRGAFFIMLATAAISMFSISVLWIVTEVRKSNDTLIAYQKSYEEEQKSFLKREVINVVNLIDFSRKYNPEKPKEEIQEEILEYVSKIRLRFGGYIFINTYQGKALIFDGVKIIGDKDISNMKDPDGLRLFDIEMECARKSDGDFFYYRFKPLDSFTPIPKVSYARGYDDWEWIIGAGIYLDDITLFMENQKNKYQAVLFKKTLYILLLFAILLLILFAISNYLSSFLRKEFDVFLSYFNKASTDNIMVNQNDLHVDEFKKLAHSVNIMMRQKAISENLITKERDKAKNYLNIAGVIILALNRDGVVTLINKKGCETLGYREDEILGKNWFTYMVPVTEKKELFNNFKKVMNGRSSNFLNRENKIISRFGKEHIIFWQNTVLYDENKNIIGSLSSGLDLTSTKKVEADFKESERKYQLLFEKSNDPVLLIDDKDRFIDCNNAALELLKCKSKKDIIGKYPYEISPENQPDGINSIDKAVGAMKEARDEGHKRFEWQHIDKEQNPFYVDVSLTVIPISGINYLYVIWRNITEKKKQESELIIAKEKAEQSDKIKTSFLNNIQHEIRTPLNAIMGFTQLLSQQKLNRDQQIEYYKDIMTSGKQLSNIINKIIDFARLQSGFILITNEIYELKKLMAEVYSYHYPNFKYSDIDFKLSFDNSDKQPLVKIDISKVKDVFGHLLDNALKFTESGSVSISYEIRTADIVFTVSDTGIGVSNKDHEFIFDKFNRVTPDNKDKLYGGNGLGLSISKATLEYLGGDIWLESVPGKGSTFTFSVPFRPVETLILSNKSALKDKNIVVVSKAKTRYDKINSLLKPLGVSSRNIRSGVEAVKYFQSGYKANLVLVDLELDQMNGITTTKAIRSFNKTVKVLAFKNKDNLKVRIEDAIAAGCIDFVLGTENDNELLITILFNLIDKSNLKF